jgi:hypothetical protein
MTPDHIAGLALLQILACALLLIAGADDDLPWQQWDISRESMVFLHALAFVFALPILAAVILAALGYGAWYLAKGPVYLARDIWRHLRPKPPQQSLPRPYDAPDAFERAAAREVEQLLTSENVL